MPYFIDKEHRDCSGWATLDAKGKVIGCHKTKQEAINHMVAVGKATGEPIGGDWNKRNNKDHQARLRK